jgi:hypothetical protein
VGGCGGAGNGGDGSRVSGGSGGGIDGSDGGNGGDGDGGGDGSDRGDPGLGVGSTVNNGGDSLTGDTRAAIPHRHRHRHGLATAAACTTSTAAPPQPLSPPLPTDAAGVRALYASLLHAYWANKTAAQPALVAVVCVVEPGSRAAGMLSSLGGGSAPPRLPSLTLKGRHRERAVPEAEAVDNVRRWVAQVRRGAR